MKQKKIQAQAVSQQVDALLAGQPHAGDDPLLATARLLAENAPAEPSPAFAQRLRRRLLNAGTSPAQLPQERSFAMWKRFAAVGMAAVIILVLVWVALPHTLSAQQVLARAAKSTAVEAGQIVYQVYTSRGNLYREWQRLEVAPDGASVPVEIMTIRYAKDDTAFEIALEAVYSAPTRVCRAVFGESNPTGDELGCQPITPTVVLDPVVLNPVAAPVETGSGSADSGYTEAIDPAVREEIEKSLREAPDAPGAPDVPVVETVREQIEQLQGSADTVNVVQAQFEQRSVYAITESQSAIRPDEEAVTRTLYIDRSTFLPVGYSYTSKGSSGDEAPTTWNILVLEYRILNAEDLDFDPFAWLPVGLP